MSEKAWSREKQVSDQVDFTIIKYAMTHEPKNQAIDQEAGQAWPIGADGGLPSSAPCVFASFSYTGSYRLHSELVEKTA